MSRSGVGSRLQRPMAVTSRRLVLVLALVTVAAGCLPSSLGRGSTPVAGTPSASVARATRSPTAAPPTPTPAPTFRVHKVASGDSLTSIARRYRTTPRSIAFWNRTRYPSLDPTSAKYAPNRIEVGWQLRVLPGQVYDENAEVPGASGEPTPLPTLVIPPPPTPGIAISLVVSAGPPGGTGVALTFDLGGRTAPNAAVVSWLVEHKVPATIFATGDAASTDAGKQALALVAAHPELLSIGNLTMDGRSLPGLPEPTVGDQITRAESVLAGLVGRSPKPLFRPPFGSQDRDVRHAAAGVGYGYTILWDVDALDWKGTATGGPTADDIVSKVLSRVQGGSIVALNTGGEETLQALPAIVAGLSDKGLIPVTLTQLLGIGG